MANDDSSNISYQAPPPAPSASFRAQFHTQFGQFGQADFDPLSSAQDYYGESHSKNMRTRTYSTRIETKNRLFQNDSGARGRRTSHDETPTLPREFIVPVDETLDLLLAREDTDQNEQITIEDAGPKYLPVGTATSNGFRTYDIRGTYQLSNFLQELTLAKQKGRKLIRLHEARLNENPVDRLDRLIKFEFWDGLTRRIDGSNIAQVGRDAKDRSADPRPRIYVPRGAPKQFEYYSRMAKEQPEIRLDVQWLQQPCDDADYIRDLNNAPGLLALDVDYLNEQGQLVDENDIRDDESFSIRGCPFIVPGGRFNELYGWDSYMESLGLLENGRVDLVESMVRNFCFCIKHYGKILNANRSYYLGRSQPPFLTDMAWRVYEQMKEKNNSRAKEVLRVAIYAAIKEYYTVWMAQPRYDPETGLSRYHPTGRGVPPETESSHFDHVLEPFLKKYRMARDGFILAYNFGYISEPTLDEFFLHDRAVRESGHDTSYRLEHVCANLATVDLNSLLFKYESDIERIIRRVFNDRLPIPYEWFCEGTGAKRVETSAEWKVRLESRRRRVDKYLWNEGKRMYFDYNTVTRRQMTYESATTFWPMWAGLPTPRQVSIMVDVAMKKFKVLGGLVAGTEESRGPISIDRPSRQWDYPFGWAPQQMMAWKGLDAYGYKDEQMELVYRWLFMVTKAFHDFNGVVVEKYDVTQPIDPHRVEAEYGNQGSDFKGIPTEGFGWVNASYVLGLSLISVHAKRALATCTPWDVFDQRVSRRDYGHDDPFCK